MHVGSVNGDTAAGRVYRFLLKHYPHKVSGWELTLGASVTAPATRVSEVRKQLPKGQQIETINEGRKFWYRLVIHDPSLTVAV